MKAQSKPSSSFHNSTHFPTWTIQHGLAGDLSVLFDQDADGDGIANGAEYAFGANLAKGEPLVRLLTVNGVLTAEVPIQDLATLTDVRVTVEFTRAVGSGIWFPAMPVATLAPAPISKQWFQAGDGTAADFHLTVRLIE